MVKPLNPHPSKKIPMVGDVTFHYCFNSHYSDIIRNAPEVRNKMIGKTVLISEKKQMVHNNPVEPYTKESRSHLNTPLTRHYRHSKIKINISRHGRKLAFQLRSEEWLTSTVVSSKNTLF
jgi:DNA polymerase-4